MAELNVAVVGCGGIGAVHLGRWSEVSGARIVGVSDPDAALVTGTATMHDAEAHTDWRSLIELPGLTVADICAPPGEQAEAVRAALERGLHVICQVPIALDLAETRALAALAEERGLKLLPALVHRFHPLVLFARELIDQDDLGRVAMVRSRFSGRLADVEQNPYADSAVSAAGALLDPALHSVDLFRSLAGEVLSASGRASTINPSLGVPDTAALVLEGEAGAIGVIEASWSTPGGRNVLEIYGTAGACIVDYDAGNLRYITADMPVWETREAGGPDRHQREILHFADALRGLQPPLLSAADAVRAQEVVEQVLRG